MCSSDLASLAVLPAAAGYGTSQVGHALGEHGSRGWAIGGAYSGLAVAVGSAALAVAIDNAQLFQGISTIAADQERTRLARNLHDQLGSSLALVGFELDRALGIARQGGDVETALVHAREQVTDVVAEMRETLDRKSTRLNSSH